MKLNWYIHEESGQASIGLLDNTLCFTVMRTPRTIQPLGQPAIFEWKIELEHTTVEALEGRYNTREQAMEAVEAWVFDQMDKVIKEGIERLKEND